MILTDTKNTCRSLFTIILPSITATLLLILTSGATAQSTKVYYTNASSPFQNMTVSGGKESHPFFADIDSDGDVDCISGELGNNGKGQSTSCIAFYINEGSSAIPAFRQVTGTKNPFNTITLQGAAIPYLIDIDADGVIDCFAGTNTGAIVFYKNTGTAAKPVFEKKSAAENPLSMVKFYGTEMSELTFADLDNDTDFDCLVTDRYGNEHYFKNTGSAAKPVFTHVAENHDPFSFLKNTDLKSVSLHDWNNDGKTDLFAGTVYYKNTGSTRMPVFTQAKENSPVIKSAIEELPLRWVDVNNDGTTEIVKGMNSGGFEFLTAATAGVTKYLSVKAYPNPSATQFTIKIPSDKNNTTSIQITDMQGRIITTYRTVSNSLQFGKELKAGSYFVSVIQNRQEIAREKIIKQ